MGAKTPELLCFPGGGGCCMAASTGWALADLPGRPVTRHTCWFCLFNPRAPGCSQGPSPQPQNHSCGTTTRKCSNPLGMGPGSSLTPTFDPSVRPVCAAAEHTPNLTTVFPATAWSRPPHWSCGLHPCPLAIGPKIVNQVMSLSSLKPSPQINKIQTPCLPWPVLHAQTPAPLLPRPAHFPCTPRALAFPLSFCACTCCSPCLDSSGSL